MSTTDLGSKHLGHITSCCKVSPRSDINQSCCRDSSLLGKWEKNAKVFAEELLQQVLCFLVAQKGQVSLPRGAVLGHPQQTYLQHQSLPQACPLKKGTHCIFSSGFSQVIIRGFSRPVLMPRGYSSECCSTTEQKDKICSKNLQS